MKNIIIIDIDDTLCIPNPERMKIANQETPDWDAFYKTDFLGDEHIDATLDLLDNVGSDGKYAFVFCTSRRERVRYQTERMIDLSLGFCIPDMVLMRPDDDERPCHILKPYLVRQAGIKFEDIAFVLDDKQSVIDEWNRLGVTTLQVRHPVKEGGE